jgi:hypothetical protein
MGLSSFFGFRALQESTENDLPEVFPMEIDAEDFVDTDVVNVYSKILTDCIERVQGIPENITPLLWDNCLQNESPNGLITLLAEAMTGKDDLFLIYDAGLSLLRVATDEESMTIESDYESKGFSPIGIFLSFQNYNRTDMVKLYSAMEYCVVASLNKLMNLSKSIQYKMGDMRGTISLADSAVAISQALSLAKALQNGKDIMIDKNDEVVTNIPDIGPIEKSISFIDSKRSFYFGMPLSYINGEQTPGIGSTGEADTKAVERGLRQYYISILKPVLEALFGIITSFKSNDFRQISSALEAMKTFELVGDDLLSRQNKQLIISKLFDVELKIEDLATGPQVKDQRLLTE